MQTPTRVVPASFFGIVLGLAGLGNGWRLAAKTWNLPPQIGETVLALAVLVWALLIIGYLWKWLAVRGEAEGELRHPVACCFVGLIFVSTALISVAVLPYSRMLAEVLAVIAGGGNLLFAAWRTGGLWQGNRDPGSTTAVLYLPAVAGNFTSAIAAAFLGYADLGILLFGAGVFSWFAIESVLIHRLYTAAPLPPAIRPTLGIQLAPPVVGCVAYLAITGKPDLFAQALFGYGLLQGAVLLRLLPWFRETGFAAGYWGFSFGVTAIAQAAIRMAQMGLPGPVAWLSPWLFAFANLFIAFLIIRTLMLLFAGKLFPAPAAAPAPAPAPAA
ncbi:MAG TPA: dicarboxylate transporter/tellurite-resistance protein TehA [Burkholderiales bacterium]